MWGSGAPSAGSGHRAASRAFPMYCMDVAGSTRSGVMGGPGPDLQGAHPFGVQLSPEGSNEAGLLMALCSGASESGWLGGVTEPFSCLSLLASECYCSARGKTKAEKGSSSPGPPRCQVQCVGRSVPVPCRALRPRGWKAPCSRVPAPASLVLSITVSFCPRPPTAEEPSATTPPRCPPPPASASGSCGSRPSLPPTHPPPSASSPSGAPTSSRYAARGRRSFGSVAEPGEGQAAPVRARLRGTWLCWPGRGRERGDASACGGGTTESTGPGACTDVHQQATPCTSGVCPGHVALCAGSRAPCPSLGRATPCVHSTGELCSSLELRPQSAAQSLRCPPAVPAVLCQHVALGPCLCYPSHAAV